MTDLKIFEPTPEVDAALGELIRAAGKFALAAATQYRAIRPEDYAGMTAAYNKGLAEMTVVVALTPNKSAQLCADVGSERRAGARCDGQLNGLARCPVWVYSIVVFSISAGARLARARCKAVLRGKRFSAAWPGLLSHGIGNTSLRQIHTWQPAARDVREL